MFKQWKSTSNGPDKHKRTNTFFECNSKTKVIIFSPPKIPLKLIKLSLYSDKKEIIENKVVENSLGEIEVKDEEKLENIKVEEVEEVEELEELEELEESKNHKTTKKPPNIQNRFKSKYTSSIIVKRGSTQNPPNENRDLQQLPLENSARHQEQIEELPEREYCNQTELIEDQILYQNKPKISVNSNHLPIIKVPTLLAGVNINCNILYTTDLLVSASKIVKTSWSVDSYQGRVHFPSNKLLLNGIFIVNVDYTNNQKIHNKKLLIPWETTTNIHWITKPKKSTSNENQFMFQSSDDMEISFHHQWEQQYIDPIQYDLRQVKMIWHDELKNSFICIQGTAELSIDLLQLQFINLNLL